MLVHSFGIRCPQVCVFTQWQGWLEAIRSGSPGADINGEIGSERFLKSYSGHFGFFCVCVVVVTVHLFIFFFNNKVKKNLSGFSPLAYFQKPPAGKLIYELKTKRNQKC